MAELNPATKAAPKAERKRIPMSVPQRKLEVPEIPGFRLYWFLETNVPRAQQGGYEFVDDKDVSLNQFNVGIDKGLSGNSDLGSHVSIFGGRDEQGKPMRLILMKIRQDWFDEDQKVIADRNAAVMGAIFQKEAIMGEGGAPEDRAQRYVKTALFQRPTRKG